MSRYQGTLLPSALEDKKVEEETRKAVLDLLKKINEAYSELLPVSGTTTRGSFVKSFDGTMTCSGTATVTTNSAFGSFFFSSTDTNVIFPEPFIATPQILVTPFGASLSVGSAFVSNRAGSSSNPSATGFFLNVLMSINATAYTVYWTANGRWK